MLNLQLRVSVNRAFRIALKERHEFITVEHLLLALLKNHDVTHLLSNHNINIVNVSKSLENFILETTPVLCDGTTTKVDLVTRPSLGFERVLQRAMFLSECKENKEVNGLHVLMAMFGERDCHAVYILKQQGVARNDLAFFMKQELSQTIPAA